MKRIVLSIMISAMLTVNMGVFAETENAELQNSSTTETLTAETSVSPSPAEAAEPAPVPADTVKTADTNIISQKEVYASLDYQPISFVQTPKLINGYVMFPIDDLINILGVNFNNIYYKYETAQLYISNNGHSWVFDADKMSVCYDGQTVEALCGPVTIDGILYAPIEYIADIFGYSVYVEEFDELVNVTIKSRLANEKEKFVNSMGYSSKTPYLIWISLNDFEVNTFIGSQGKWSSIKNIKCSVGTPSTPTVKGEFEFFSLEPRWSYKNYYVGPIMRFYRGYAIHTVLMKYDGTFYDGRVGQRLSHGCIRVLPDDMQWLTYYVPLNTKIIIT